MRFSVGFWDELFGERVDLDLGHGRSRRVTKKWLDQAQRRGQLKELEIITVRVIDLNHRPPKGSLDGWNPRWNRIEHWVLGRDIPAVECERLRDPETGDFFAIQSKGEERPGILEGREVWDKIHSQLVQMDAKRGLSVKPVDVPPQ